MLEREALKRSFHINQVLIDPKNYFIEKEGKKEEITSRTLDLLLFLIQKEGQIATREEIEKEVWNGSINDNSLYQQITSLRKYLGDNPNKPVFIKTVPKRGYQFVGELNFSLQKPKTQQLRKYTKPVASTLLALIAISTIYIGYKWFYNNTTEVEKIASTLLQYPRQTIAVEIPDQLANHPYPGLMQSLNLILEYYLDIPADQHIAQIPVDLEKQILPDLFHKNANLSHTIRFDAKKSSDDLLSITLEIYNIANKVVEHNISIEIPEKDQALVLPNFEYALLKKLKSSELIPKDTQPLFLNDINSNKIILNSAKSIASPVRDTGLIEKSIPLTLEAIKLNPGNLIVYNLIWEQIYNLIYLNSEFYLDKSMNILNSTIEDALEINPNYHKAHYMKGEYHYWLRDALEKSDTSLHGSIDAFKKSATIKPYDPNLLLALSWHSIYFNDHISTPINQFNYELNPFNEKVIYHYRNSLLSDRKFLSAVNLIDKFGKHAPQNNNWHIQAQTPTNLETLQRFATEYRKLSFETKNLEHMRRQLSYNGTLPSKYIGLLLLDSNQPDLASYWAKNGFEKAAYFDFKAIDLKADIWSNTWKPEKWNAILTLIKSNPWPPNQLDKLNILYFHYKSGFFKNAEETVLSIFPELQEPGFIINENNFRYAVYYSEITRKLNKFKKSIVINKIIKSYLEKNDGKIPRGLHFGLSDAEYYAANGDEENAIRILEKAIYEKNWLPNSFWLWPPIDSNPFFGNLKKDIRFQKLSAHLNKKLQSICFNSTCK